MTKEEQKTNQKRGLPKWRKWIRRAFLTWAVFSTLWVINSFRTQGVDSSLLQSDASVSVRDENNALKFLPASGGGNNRGVIFICGAGVGSDAYAPLLRPIADSGFPVMIIKLPFRLAPLESHKQKAMDRVHHVMAEHPGITKWVLSGHSLGAVIACRVARHPPPEISALILIGTTHPRDFSLASLKIPVTKVYGSMDNVAPSYKIHGNKHLLPERTEWVQIEGANHSQFGHYGHQLRDGSPTISRSDQQTQTRTALLNALNAAVPIIE